MAASSISQQRQRTLAFSPGTCSPSGEGKPAPGEGQTDSKGIFWTLPKYVGSKEKVDLFPLGKEQFQLLICLDSKVMHKIMYKMGATETDLHSGAELSKFKTLG